MNARVTSESQSFRLVERMEEAKISHGQELRADLSNVRVLALAGVAELQAPMTFATPWSAVMVTSVSWWTARRELCGRPKESARPSFRGYAALSAQAHDVIT